jgi:hypothetical protein
MIPFRHAVGGQMTQLAGAKLHQLVGQALQAGQISPADAQSIMASAGAMAPASYPSPAQWSPLQEVPLPGNGPRTFPMGFGLTAIAAGASTTINANPQVNFRPDRLVIPDSIAPSFMINDFKIGMRSQFVAPGSVPAQSFTQGAIDTLMLLDTVNVGQFVTLDVTNVSTQTVNFAATLFGKTLNS